MIASILSNITGNQGRVIALEASFYNASIAIKNCAANSLSRLTIINKAVGNSKCELSFSKATSTESNVRVQSKRTRGFKNPTVQCTTIDDLSKEFGYPDVLFIDVEEYEVNVLHGATQTLKHYPDCFVEVHVGTGLEDYGYIAQDVLNFFEMGRYNIFTRPHKNKEFQQLKKTSDLPKEHFHLVAISLSV